jgi:hypothetical protein
MRIELHEIAEAPLLLTIRHDCRYGRDHQTANDVKSNHFSLFAPGIDILARPVPCTAADPLTSPTSQGAFAAAGVTTCLTTCPDHLDKRH